MSGQGSWGDYLGDIERVVAAAPRAKRRRSGFWLGFVSGATVVAIIGGAAAAIWLSSASVTQASPTAPTSAVPTSTPSSAGTFDSLVIGETDRDGSYDRDAFGQSWADIDRNGCDTRNDILGRDLIDIEFKEGTNDCKVLSGTLVDSYSGDTIPFIAGQDTSADVQIDHLLPLKAVYATGGEAWPAEKREALANDPVNLLAVKGTENSSKSDSLPSEWLPGFYPDVSDRHDLGQRVVWDDLPTDTTLQCWYVDKLVPVFVAYDLGVTPEDRAALTAVLESCPA